MTIIHVLRLYEKIGQNVNGKRKSLTNQALVARSVLIRHLNIKH